MGMAPITLLIVDDEEDMLEVYAQMFASKEFHCMRAKNVKEALLLMESVRPDVVITDMIMPNGSGDIISAIASDRGIPTIVCSGIVDATALKLPANAQFMAKPMKSADIIARVKEMASEARAAA